MILKSGREVPDELLDEVIDTTIIQYAGFGFEDLSDSKSVTVESLQEDEGWLPDSNNLTYEEALEVMEIVSEPIRHFSIELAQVYSMLKSRYVGTNAWELYRR